MTAVHKAQPLGPRSKPIPDLSIEATRTFPDIKDPRESAALHDLDAQRIVADLLAILPGGTVDAVLRRLLDHRASLLRVRWPE